MPTIPFFKPVIDEDTIARVSEVLRSGWLTTGSVCEEFETAFAKYVGAKHAVSVNSATAALHLCMASLNLKPGDEVITTPYTFVATAEVIEYFNAKPVFVDIREDTMNIDEGKIEKAITSKTRAIVPVHFAGQPCEMDEILAIAKKHGLPVFEDAAHVTPAYYKGRPIGSISNGACFSFYANKCITTGEGGMLTTDDDELAAKFRILRLHGLSRDAIDRYQSKGSWQYDVIAQGYKYNLTDIAAAIGIGQLAQADRWEERKRVVKTYRELLGNKDDIQMIEELEHNQSSWHIFPIRFKNHADQKRDELIQKINAKGISTSVHFIPIHTFTYYREKYGYKPGDFPNAYNAFRRLITLPVYPGLKDEGVEYICGTILEDLQ